MGVETSNAYSKPPGPDLARAKQFGKEFWDVAGYFSLREGHYTPPAWMTWTKNLHAFGVDDTLLVIALATSCSQCGSL